MMYNKLVSRFVNMEVMKLNTELLKKRISESSFTLEDVAERLNLSRQSLSYKLSGKREFKLIEIRGLCTLLNLDVEDTNAIFFADCVTENVNKTVEDVN